MNSLSSVATAISVDSLLSRMGLLERFQKNCTPEFLVNFSPHKENSVLGCHSIIRVDGSRFIKQKQNTENKNNIQKHKTHNTTQKRTHNKHIHTYTHKS